MTNKLKPFDLQAALKGEPVMLRNGMKAFVRHHETELAVGDDSQIWGVVVRDDAEVVTLQWTQQGRFLSSKVDKNEDIVGMYPKTRIINGFEVPVPETEEPNMNDAYFSTGFLSEDLYEKFHWITDSYDFILLERGLVFLTKEDAIANAKAMLGINPYEEGEE